MWQRGGCSAQAVGKYPIPKGCLGRGGSTVRIVNPDANTDYVPYSARQDWAVSEVLGPYLLSACSVNAAECWNSDFPPWILQADVGMSAAERRPALAHDWRVFGEQDV